MTSRALSYSNNHGIEVHISKAHMTITEKSSKDVTDEQAQKVDKSTKGWQVEKESWKLAITLLCKIDPSIKAKLSINFLILHTKSKTFASQTRSSYH